MAWLPYSTTIGDNNNKTITNFFEEGGNHNKTTTKLFEEGGNNNKTITKFSEERNSVIDLAVQHVEPPSNISAAVCFRTLFGDIKDWFDFVVSRFVGEASDTARSLERISKNGTQASSSGGGTSLSKQQLEATRQCLHKLQKSSEASLRALIEEGIPPLVNVHFTAQDTLRLLFNTKALKKRTKKKLLGNASWFCDSEKYPAHVWDPDPHGHSLILECPGHTATRVFHSFGQTYALEPFLDCERRFPSLLPPPPAKTNNHSELLLAMCTSVRGESAMALVPEWIEYHRLLGFDQFWIYVNDDWNLTQTGELLSQYFHHPEVQEYVAWIPYDWVHIKNFYYQQAIQNDCLHLGQRQNVAWMALNDVDKFFQMRSDNLTSFRDFVTANYDDKPEVASLQVANWFFGGASPTSDETAGTPSSKNGILQPPRRPLILEYVHSAPEPTRKGKRAKHIVRPDQVVHFSVHRVTQAKGRVEALDPDTQLRMAHFKQPHKGVTETASQSAVLDTTLKEQFGCPLQKRLSYLLGRSLDLGVDADCV